MPPSDVHTNRLLALCARAECDATQYERIEQAAARVTDWDSLAPRAEAHLMTPLLYRHLNGRVSLARSTRRDLQGLVLRHRLTSQTRTRVLIDVLSAYRTAGIPVLVLKGAALAHTIYPEPDLRPMRDLDLLVRRGDAFPAQRILSDLGFDAPTTMPGSDPAHRHLSCATCEIEGFLIGVEVHHNLFEPGSSPVLRGLDDLIDGSIEFSIEPGVQARTLGHADALWYLCQHLIESTNVFSSVGLIWVADIVSYAEKFSDQIDWGSLDAYPIVRSTLSLVHFLTPLSPALISRAGITIGREPRGMWDDLEKLPRTPPESMTGQGAGRMLRAAFLPSEWWMRLHYGTGSANPQGWRHWVRHLRYLAARFAYVAQRTRRARESRSPTRREI